MNSTVILTTLKKIEKSHFQTRIREISTAKGFLLGLSSPVAARGGGGVP
jgi:hypothetical protein